MTTTAPAAPTITSCPIHGPSCDRWPKTGLYRYEGVDKDGRSKGGTLDTARTNTATVAQFVESLYERRWRSLIVYPADGDRDEPVGGINPHPSNGHRTWWGDR